LPTEPEPVLPAFLDLCGAIAVLPIEPFLGENDMTGEVAPAAIDKFVDQHMCLGKTIVGGTPAGAPQFVGFGHCSHSAG
jgi:hypothetical protein